MNQRFYSFCEDLINPIMNNDYSYVDLEKTYPEDVDDDTLYYVIDDIEDIISNLGHKGRVSSTFNLMYRILSIKDKLVMFQGSFDIIIDDTSYEFIKKFIESLKESLGLTNVYIQELSKVSDEHTISLQFNVKLTYDDLKKGFLAHNETSDIQ